MYTVQINDKKFQYKLPEEMPEGWDCLEYKEGGFHVLFNDKTFNAELLEVDHQRKSFSIKVNQHTYTLQIEDEYDQLIQQMGFSGLSTQRVNQVKAPMPGLVVDVLVKPGQSVEKGDSLLILGAMKMDNVIKSPGEGVVKLIPVEKGAAVDKNQVLIELE